LSRVSQKSKVCPVAASEVEAVAGPVEVGLEPPAERRVVAVVAAWAAAEVVWNGAAFPEAQEVELWAESAPDAQQMVVQVAAPVRSSPRSEAC